MRRQAIRDDGTIDDGVSDLGHAVKSAVSRLYSRFRSERPDGDLGDGALEVLALLDRGGPQTLTALSEHHRVTPASMSQTVNRLASVGYAVRARDPDDGRRVIIRATPMGKRLSQAARTRRNAWIDDRLGELSDDERETLAAAAVILKRIADA
ncbi:MarR family transcriptional regulator [Lapillicoccus sp.]|uniref:MarR family winged helix-turn-helix transcriptional regulator n=1 Tax=Lapillicoccus sp. TaxID=1909287 RepID=UPI0025CE6B05|nr:MarR family transcriptional regulator [Lapillicoccus sp.]